MPTFLSVVAFCRFAVPRSCSASHISETELAYPLSIFVLVRGSRPLGKAWSSEAKQASGVNASYQHPLRGGDPFEILLRDPEIPPKAFENRGAVLEALLDQALKGLKALTGVVLKTLQSH